MKPITWFVFAYQVPSEPSKARVYAWRKLKELGAVYFKQSVVLLPKSPANLAKLRTLAAKILDLGGEATIAEMRFIDIEDEEEMIARFRQQSKAEYRDFITDMIGFRDNIVINREIYDFDDRAKKMAKRYAQMRSRDYFKSRATPEVSSSLEELLGDMSHATDSLARHLAQMILEKDKL